MFQYPKVQDRKVKVKLYCAFSLVSSITTQVLKLNFRARHCFGLGEETSSSLQWSAMIPRRAVNMT